MNSNHRILVVEAEHDFRQLTAEALKDAGHQVETAYDEEGAWAALQVSRYDLLIIDQLMPMLPGIELLEKIHSSRITLPIIMTTGFSAIEEFTRHPYFKQVQLLIKPYSFEKLLILARHCLPETLSTGGKY